MRIINDVAMMGVDGLTPKMIDLSTHHHWIQTEDVQSLNVAVVDQF